MKLRLLDDTEMLESADLPGGPTGGGTAALEAALRGWATPDAVGHRIVHGGSVFSGAVRVTGSVREQLGDLTDLAPLHQPASLAALDAVTAQLPDIPAVATFDTAFHTTIPEAAATYAVPKEWRERYRIRRYGFHGLSHSYCSRRCAEILGRPVVELRIITAHLGAGASLAAVVDGRSVDTTMGFTPLEGLVMATRSGTVDPGLILWLEEHQHLAPREVATALEEHSGLTALAGTGDMRAVEAAAARGEPDAELALAVYVHRLAGGIAAMCASAGGLDVLAFTGGVGENSATVRRLTVERLAFLGLAVDRRRNDGLGGSGRAADLDITGAPESDHRPRVLVVSAREDLEIARQTRDVIDAR